MMTPTGPSASEIRSAKTKAVGGGRKRCRKGKNCSATCIAGNKYCLVDLPEPVAAAMPKVVGVVRKKKEGVGAVATSTPSGGGASQELSGVDKIQKMGDDGRLKKLENTAEEYKKRWADTIGKGDLEATKKAWDTYQFVKKDYDDFKKEYDDKYNRPVAKSPKELMSSESKRVRDRIQSRIDEGTAGQKPEVVARWKAAREEAFKDFKKLSDDQLAALGLYGENKSKYYMDVNKFLRTGSMEGIPAERQQIVRNITSNMNGALTKLPASSETNFERAVSGPGARGLQGLKVGDIIEDKGFGSYTTAGKSPTLDQFFRQGEDNALMRVTSRNARDVSPVMEFRREAEHILRPGTRLRVTEVIEANAPGAMRSRKVGSTPTYVFEEVE
jgi:hypothetical protein